MKILYHAPGGAKPLGYSDYKELYSELQYKVNRSAYKLWNSLWNPEGPQLPDALQDFLVTEPRLGQFVVDQLLPEYTSSFSGLGHIHDLMVLGHTGEHKILMALEARTDEPLDPRTAQMVVAAGHQMMMSGTVSSMPRHIYDILEALFPKEEHADALQASYRLMLSLAGTLSEMDARGVGMGICCVMNYIERQAEAAQESLLKVFGHRNEEDLDRFVGLVSGGEYSRLHYNKLCGPISIRGGMQGQLANKELYFLKLEQ